MKKLFSIMSNFQAHYHFNLDLKNWANKQRAIG